MQLALIGRSFEAKRRRRSPVRSLCHERWDQSYTSSARLPDIHPCVQQQQNAVQEPVLLGPEHLEELQVETDDSVAAIVQTLAAAGDSGKNSVIDPRLAAGLQRSWHRWSCEFPGHMNHNNIRMRIEDVVTSQQNELLGVQFRREECKD